MPRGARLSLEQLAPYLLEVPRPNYPIPAPSASEGAAPHPSLALGAGKPFLWPAVFGNDRPVECEVGYGKGLFLQNESQRRPEVNFVGIEIERKYQMLAASRIARRGLTNVRLACGDALRFFRELVTPSSLQAVHVYFPDPWWKKRHHKRRLFTAEFVGECVRVLRPGGELHVATDVEEYFTIMKGLLAEQPRLTELPPPEVREPEHEDDYLTSFERKYRKEGRPVYRALYRAE